MECKCENLNKDNLISSIVYENDIEKTEKNFIK